MRDMPMDYEEPRISFKPRKWPVITPEMHEAIKRLYRSKVDCSGEVNDFCRRKGLPKWKVSRYAQEQAWISKGKKEPNWSDKELLILQRASHNSPSVIARKLRERGFKRSIVGIVIKRKRMRFLQNLEGQSAHGLARCLGEDEHFVTRAIHLGLLKAKRRELDRLPQQGGNPWYIREKNAREFIINNLHMIDLRKVDKYWFVDLLVNGDRAKETP